VSKLIVIAVVGCAAAAAWFMRSRKRSNGLRGHMKEAGERLKDAESRVEEAIRS
jgi:hypothetical protein